jgi:hypothetical protein
MLATEVDGQNALLEHALARGSTVATGEVRRLIGIQEVSLHVNDDHRGLVLVDMREARVLSIKHLV